MRLGPRDREGHKTAELGRDVWLNRPRGSQSGLGHVRHYLAMFAALKTGPAAATTPVPKPAPACCIIGIWFRTRCGVGTEHSDAADGRRRSLLRSSRRTSGQWSELALPALSHPLTTDLEICHA